MPWFRIGRVVASASIVVLLSAAIGVRAEPIADQAVEAAIPMPEPANLPPPTAADFDQPAAGSVQPADTAKTPSPSQDAAIAQQLQGLGNGKLDGIIAGKQDRAIIDAFYSGRDYAPLWVTDGKPNARARRDCLSPRRRRRWPRSGRLSGAGFHAGRRSGRSCRRRDAADHVGDYLRASRQHRTRALVAGQW